MDAYPRDLLQRFRSNHNHARQSEYTSPNEETEELELNLGLSLGGKFGVDKSPKKLFRSSSIAGAIHLVREEDKDNPAAPPFLTYPTLIRTSSLPTETEEEWRKRKELQSLRRMEAKRRRLEKQRSLRADREGGEDERLEIEGKSSFDSRDKQRFLVTDKAGSNGVLRVPPFRLNGWIEAAKQALIGGGIGVGIKVNCGDFGGCHEGHGGGSSNGGSAGLAVRSLQGSVESVRGDSAGMSESESKPIEDQGSSSCRGERSLNVNQHLQEQSNKLAVRSPSLSKDGNSGSVLRADTQIPSKTPKSLENEGTAALGMNKMTDMPSVFTRGDGPNGKRVEGILYKYGRGEEVRIMCICHGKFLSPAEFVKHAGGGDVANPRKHIFISANPVFSQ